MPADAALLHAHTPTLVVVDPRGVAIRRARYWRTDVGDPAEVLVERRDLDGACRIRSAWDPRLGIPSLRLVTSLGGVRLRSDHVDAGWEIELRGPAGESNQGWDARGFTRLVDYDGRLRPVAVREGKDVLRCTERLAYGTARQAGFAGRLVRHDDTAGTVWIEAYALVGGIVAEKRRFLLSMDEPDWPEPEAARDALLEAEPCISRRRYDARGGVWQETDAAGYVRRRTVDVAGQPMSSSVRFEGVEETVFSGVVHDAAGRVVLRQDGHGDIEYRAGYSEADGRQVRLSRSAPGSPLQDIEYEYDGVGNVVTVVDRARPTDWFDLIGTEPVHRYTYDTLDQLTGATGRESVLAGDGTRRPPPVLPGQPVDRRMRNYEETYRHDAGGNLVALEHKAVEGTFSRRFVVEEGSNRAVPDDHPGATFDPCGNLLELRPGIPMAWDARGRLSRVGPGEGVDERYQYDGGGSRVRKRSGSGEVRYLHGLERHRDGSGHATFDTLHLAHAEGVVRIVSRLSDFPSDVPRRNWRIQVADLLGSVSLETKASGEVLTEEAFHPFGTTARWAARDADEPADKARRYGGKASDRTELSYYGYRYYAPWLGRWISPDPAGDIDGLNRYRFASNNPCSGTDSDGLFFEMVRRRFDAHIKRKRTENSIRELRAHVTTTGLIEVDRALGAPSTSANPATEGLEQAILTVNRAHHVLHRRPGRAREVVAGHLGNPLSDDQWTETRRTLMEGLEGMRNDLFAISEAGDRRLMLLGTVPERMVQADAATHADDPGRRIYINRSRLMSHFHTATVMKYIFLHEPTHQFPRPHATLDIRYFDYGSPAATSRLSRNWAANYVAPASAFPVSNKSAEALAIRQIGPKYGNLSENDRKRHMILHNADSWRVIAMDLSEEYQA